MMLQTSVRSTSPNGGRRSPPPPTMAARGRWALVACAFLAAGCARDGTSSATASPPVPEEPRLDLFADAPWPPAYTADPLWVRASAGDDLDRARLARRENAGSLLGVVQSGGSLGRVALSAFAYSSDRRSVRLALCELCGRAAASSRGLLLDALLDAVLNAPPTEETRDANADARCTRALEALVQSADTAPAERDRAAVVLGRLRAP
jgi:hypothetical protein